MMIFDEDLKIKVEEFVKNGGTLVLSYRAGIKDRNNNLVFSQISPGIYKELAGVTVEEIESLGIGQEIKLIGKLNYEGHCGRGYVFRDLLKLEGAKALYEYDDPFFKNMAAISLNEFSKGKVYYIGTGASEEIMDNIVNEITLDLNIDTIKTPIGLEAYIRGSENNRYMFLMNHSSNEIKYMEHNFAPYESLILKLN